MSTSEPKDRALPAAPPPTAASDDGVRVVFTSPRALPSARELPGRVVVLDVAFAADGLGTSFVGVTLKFIQELGSRLAAWVDHHDHDSHGDFRGDPRFILSTKAEHGACPEMVTPEVVRLAGPVDTIVCHLDVDGLYAAAKWLRGGTEPYAGADDDARAVDTRIGEPSPEATRIDHALRAHWTDETLKLRVVHYLVTGLTAGIDRDSIFNVSDVDQGVRTGQYFVPYIRTMIQKSAVVLAWITPRYVESSFCMCELGAAWALCDDAVPFLPLIDDLGYNQLPGVLHGMQVLNASEGQVLDKFSNELAQLLGIQGKQKAATWNRHKADFYASYPALKASNPATPAKPNSKTPILKRVKVLVTSLRESENKKSTMPMISPAQAAQFNALLEEAKQIGVDTKIQPFPAKPGGAGVHFGMTATPFSDLIASLVMLAADLED